MCQVVGQASVVSYSSVPVPLARQWSSRHAARTGSGADHVGVYLDAAAFEVCSVQGLPRYWLSGVRGGRYTLQRRGLTQALQLWQQSRCGRKSPDLVHRLLNCAWCVSWTSSRVPWLRKHQMLGRQVRCIRYDFFSLHVLGIETLAASCAGTAVVEQMLSKLRCRYIIVGTLLWKRLYRRTLVQMLRLKCCSRNTVV